MAGKRKTKMTNATGKGYACAQPGFPGEDSHDVSTASRTDSSLFARVGPAVRGGGLGRARRQPPRRLEALPASRARPAPARGAGRAEGSEGRQGPPRVPEDLLGPARPHSGDTCERVRGQRPRGLEARGRPV